MELIDQIFEFFTKLFGTESWPPRWRCGRWTDFHGWLYILSDLTIAASYFAIPFLLVKFVTKKRDLPLPIIFWLFGAFILLCGLTHLIDAAIFWWPAYRLSALLKFLTAVVSVLTLIELYKLFDVALTLKTSKQFEEEIKYRQDLELALVKEKTVAQESQKAKELFLANMSHEIRSPMNAIIGFTRLFNENKSNLTTEQRQWLHAIRTSGENLLVIINDILDFSKLNSGKEEFEQNNIVLQEFLFDTINSLSFTATDKNIKLELEVQPELPSIIIGDQVRLNQILLNLLSNAIKFTSAGSVKLKVELIENQQEILSIKFSVTDTGIGISEDKLSKIFESFTQASKSITTQYGGTGLGLTISKKLVELQGGSIDVESEIGKGSTFSFVLPFINPNTNESVSTITLVNKDEFKNLTGLSVLLFEDNEINQKLAKIILQKNGMKVDIAQNGQLGLELFAKRTHDVILMDLQMPVMDGYETTAYIRNVLNNDVPIIAMTAHASKSEVDKCKAAGMNDYISKPFDTNNLLNKILIHTKK